MYVILQPKIQYINDMKKIALVLAFAVMSFAAVAQDTMHFGSQYYMFNEYEPGYFENCKLCKYKLCQFMPLVGYVAQRDDSVTVYGVAYLGWLEDSAHLGVSLAKKNTGLNFTRYDTAYFDTSTVECFYHIDRVRDEHFELYDTVVPLY